MPYDDDFSFITHQDSYCFEYEVRFSTYSCWHFIHINFTKDGRCSSRCNDDLAIWNITNHCYATEVDFMKFLWRLINRFWILKKFLIKLRLFSKMLLIMLTRSFLKLILLFRWYKLVSLEKKKHFRLFILVFRKTSLIITLLCQILSFLCNIIMRVKLCWWVL